MLAVAPVEDYTPAVAEHHAALLAHVRHTGTPPGAHELIIAATARATGRILLTTDGNARFGELPDVDLGSSSGDSVSTHDAGRVAQVNEFPSTRDGVAASGGTPSRVVDHGDEVIIP